MSSDNVDIVHINSLPDSVARGTPFRLEVSYHSVAEGMMSVKVSSGYTITPPMLHAKAGVGKASDNFTIQGANPADEILIVVTLRMASDSEGVQVT